MKEIADKNYVSVQQKVELSGDGPLTGHLPVRSLRS